MEIQKAQIVCRIMQDLSTLIELSLAIEKPTDCPISVVGQNFKIEIPALSLPIFQRVVKLSIKELEKSVEEL